MHDDDRLYFQSFLKFNIPSTNENVDTCRNDYDVSAAYCSTEKLTADQLQLKLENDHRCCSELLQRSLLVATSPSESNFYVAIII